MICINVYITYLMTLGYKCASYILNYFFQYLLSNILSSTPLKKKIQTQNLEMTSSVNHQSASIILNKDTDMCLPRNWLLDQNIIACFPPIGHHCFSLTVVACMGISDIANANCICMFVSDIVWMSNANCKHVRWWEEAYRSLLFTVG